MYLREGRSLTQAEKDRLVEEMRGSGQVQKEWCAQHEIPLRTLRQWISGKNRREREIASQATAWIEATEQPTETAVTQAALVEVNIGSYVVRVSRGFDRTSFMEVCKALSELC